MFDIGSLSTALSLSALSARHGENPAFMYGLIALAIWSLIWKGLALWKAGRQGSMPWFIVLLVVNTIGILDILYLYVFSKKGDETNVVK